MVVLPLCSLSRRNPMGLIVALDGDSAEGELFWDDGDSTETVSSGRYTHYRFSVGTQPTTVTVITDRTTTTQLPFENVTYNATKQVPIKQHLELGKTYLVNWDNYNERFDCHPEENGDEAKCTARGCIWRPISSSPAPGVFYPVDYGAASTGPFSVRGRQISTSCGWRSTTTVVHMVQFKIYDPANKRYEVPVPLNVPNTPETNATERSYEVRVVNFPFGIQVVRKSTKTVIWDSSLPGFTFSDLFIQISTRVPYEYIYGFGETEHRNYAHNFYWHTWGMFSKDQPPGDNFPQKAKFLQGDILLRRMRRDDGAVWRTATVTALSLIRSLSFSFVLPPSPQ
ncbi:hypothetical protein SKAU_G00080490 [Synaphobranchus kaupii]|uniref:P-type domain-containing protein n=1 Tax=Synaphobranchus kaupii TaxID=118154 RepID=A0A9Q1FUQ5_SYNKA|nr:hypothetical protein SKAU_G00080490 [Synaphobranchus kaupii]